MTIVEGSLKAGLTRRRLLAIAGRRHYTPILRQSPPPPADASRTRRRRKPTISNGGDSHRFACPPAPTFSSPQGAAEPASAGFAALRAATGQARTLILLQPNQGESPQVVDGDFR